VAVGFEVVTGAVRAEAPKWDGFATQVGEVHRHVESATLGPTAFFVGDPSLLSLTGLDAALHYAAYESFRSHVETVLSGAATEFGQIADVLVKIATAYEQAEKITELRLSETYKV
jgi:hypothetical protein